MANRDTVAKLALPASGKEATPYPRWGEIINGVLKMGAEIQFGTVEGTGSPIVVATEFDPACVILINQDDPTLLVHSPSMPAASGLKLTDAPALTFPTTNGVTLGTKQFTIGADADVNAAAETLHWIAIGSSGAVGS